MSIIYSFLQKRKMHENQHGYIMVFIAYIISALMLALGSDVFYNINSNAAGTSADRKEETQELLNTKLPDLKSAEYTTQIIETALINPYGLTESETEDAGEEILSTSTSADTVWLLGNAMDVETFDSLMVQMGSLDFVSNAAEKEKKAAEKAKTSSLSVNKTISSEYGDITEKEVKMLERIVEAEASGEDIVGKILIVNVILNRVADDAFPDTIKGVIFQKSDDEYQFSPVSDERYWSVAVSKETKKAVERALEGEDYSKGALYFVARKRSNASSVEWFDDHLDWLFKHGGHEFYKNK